MDQQIRSRSWHVLLLALVAFTWWGPSVHGQELFDHWYQPNGPVDAILVDTANGLVHIGGGFTAVGKNTPYGVTVDGTHGHVLPGAAKPNGQVNKVVADGQGGWYVLGTFTHIGADARQYLARLHPDGSLHPWQAHFDELPLDLLVHNGQLHVIGSFSQVNGEYRHGWAAFDIGSGQLLPMGGSSHIGLTHPRTIAISGDTAYIGGSELNMLPEPTRHALINVQDGGSIATWPMPDVLPSACIGDGAGGWILGGSFTEVAGESRNGLAWYGPDGSLQAWAPNVEGMVNTLLLVDGTLYAGGEFSSIDGQPRRNIAAFDWNSGTLLPFGTDDQDTPTGAVGRLRMADGRLFMSGNFRGMGPVTRNSSFLDPTDGSWVQSFAGANNPIRTAVPDGDGGWFIGGDFTEVAGAVRKRLARINADGSLHPWAPEVSGNVYCLAREGNSLYVGGEISEVDGISRSGLAEFDLGSGALTPWAPATNGKVTGIALADTMVFITGTFTSVGNEPHTRIARISRATGMPLTIIGFNAEVHTMVPVGDKLFVGGNFPERIKVLNIHTGWSSGWNFPLPNGAVRHMAVAGDTLYVTGAFNWIGGETRNGVAAFNVSTNQPGLLSWVPTTTATDLSRILVNGSQILFTRTTGILAFDRSDGNLLWETPLQGLGGIHGLALSQGTLFCGGYFTCMPCQPQRFIAAIDPTNCTLLDWRPVVNLGVWDLVIHDEQLIIGGDFTLVNGVARNRVASLSVDNGELLPLNPNVNGTVKGLTVGNDELFLHGDFTSVNSNARNRVAKLELSSGALAAWNPPINGTVRSLIAREDHVLLAGGFSTTDGSGRIGLVAMDRSTADVLPWMPDRSGPVNGMVMQEGLLFVHGLLGAGTSQRKGIAAVRLSTAEVLPFNANANNQVDRLLLDGDRLFAAGSFTQMAGQSRSRLAVLDRFTGDLGSWAPQPNGPVNALVLHGGHLFLGGNFTQIGGQPRNRIAVYTMAWNHLQPWSPNVSGEVKALHVANGMLYMGGNFTSVNGQDRPYAAAFNVNTWFPHEWSPSPGGHVTSIGSNGGSIYLGGQFTTMNNVKRIGYASLLLETGAPGPFQIQMPQGAVTEMALYGSKLYIGGTFNNVNGHTRNGLAAVEVPSGDVAPFPTNGNGVEVLLLSHDTLFAGGNFSHVNGQVRTRLAALDAATGELLPWSPSANGHVLALAKKGSWLYVGGNFSHLGGQTRPYLGAYELPSGTVNDWQPQPDQTVHALTVAGEHIMAGGKFNEIGYAMRRGVAMLDASTGHATGWNADLNGDLMMASMFPYASTILSVDTGIFVSGEFTSANGQPRNRLVLLDPASGAPSEWNAGVKSGQPPIEIARCLAYHEGVLFVGGWFKETLDQIRHNFAPISVCDATIFYADMDGDGFGDPATGQFHCSPGQAGHVTNALDCDDSLHGQEIGSPCDDGDPATVDDTWTADCTCEGMLPTGVNSTNGRSGLRAYPNPVDHTLYFSEPVTGTMHDVQGRLVLSLAREQQIDVTGLAPGMYQLRSVEGAVIRFVKQ